MPRNMGILLTQLHIYTMEIIQWFRVLICFICEWVDAAFVSAPRTQSVYPRPETEPFALGLHAMCCHK